VVGLVTTQLATYYKCSRGRGSPVECGRDLTLYKQPRPRRQVDYE